jgi:hypothetical protein
MRWLLIILYLACPGAVLAQSYSEPARGSALRADLMDAMRPHAEWALGPPIEFVVDELRVSGDIAFAMLSAQRPGGGAIDMWSTPMAARGQYEPELGDPLQFQALLVLSGRTWVAVEWGHASTDVWWAWTPICARFRPVIPEYC